MIDPARPQPSDPPPLEPGFDPRTLPNWPFPEWDGRAYTCPDEANLADEGFRPSQMAAEWVRRCRVELADQAAQATVRQRMADAEAAEAEIAAFNARAKIAEARRRTEARRLVQVMVDEYETGRARIDAENANRMAQIAFALIDDADLRGVQFCTGIVAQTNQPCTSPAKPGTDRCGKHQRSRRPQFYSPNGNTGE